MHLHLRGLRWLRLRASRLLMPSQGVAIFSCARDIELARLAVGTVPRDWPVCVIIEPRDIEAFQGFPSEALIVCDFPRGETLDGQHAVLGVVRALRLAARHIGDPEHLAKVDSDCLLYDPGFLDPDLTGRGLRGFAHHLRPGAALGLAYAMETALLAEVEAVLKGWLGIQDARQWGEDVAITTAAQVALGDPFGSDHRRPFSAIFWDAFDGATPGPNKLAGHYRGRTNLRKRGVTDEAGFTEHALASMRRDLAARPHLTVR